MKKPDFWRKIELYIMSLMILFILLIIKAFKVPNEPASLKDWFISNTFTIVFLAFLLISILCTIRFFNSLSGAVDIPAKVTKIKNGNYEYITFLMSYILPLICFDLSSPSDCIVLISLLIILGILFINTNLYCLNPVIAILGLKIHIASIAYKGETIDDIYILSKDKIHIGDIIFKHDIEKNEVSFCKTKRI